MNFTLYFLPKIHKAERPAPWRPIVSASGCPTDRISALVDHFLSPYMLLLPSYIKDTTDFLLKIVELLHLPTTALIFTMDVKSLYINIPNIEALKVAKAMLNLHRDDTNEHLKNNDIVCMLALEFNNDHYLQIQGVAMGTRSAPTIANQVMGDFKVKHVYTYPKQPYLWIRFIDDNIGIWLHELQEFFKYLNSCYRTIKFTFEYSETSLPFLDTNTTIGTDGVVYATLYSKPTDTHPYLQYQSCHPHHQNIGGPYSQLLRVRRICAHDTDFELNAHMILEHYKHQGYPATILQSALDKVRLKPCVGLLRPIAEEPTSTE